MKTPKAREIVNIELTDYADVVKLIAGVTMLISRYEKLTANAILREEDDEVIKYLTELEKSKNLLKTLRGCKVCLKDTK